MRQRLLSGNANHPASCDIIPSPGPQDTIPTWSVEAPHPPAFLTLDDCVLQAGGAVSPDVRRGVCACGKAGCFAFFAEDAPRAVPTLTPGSVSVQIGPNMMIPPLTPSMST